MPYVRDQKTRSTAYYLEGNGQVENIHKTLKSMLKCRVARRAGVNTWIIAGWLIAVASMLPQICCRPSEKFRRCIPGCPAEYEVRPTTPIGCLRQGSEAYCLSARRFSLALHPQLRPGEAGKFHRQ